MTKMVNRYDHNANPPVFDVTPIGDGMFRVYNEATAYDEEMSESVVMLLFKHKPLTLAFDRDWLEAKVRDEPDGMSCEAGAPR